MHLCKKLTIIAIIAMVVMPKRIAKGMIKAIFWWREKVSITQVTAPDEEVSNFRYIRARVVMLNTKNNVFALFPLLEKYVLVI
jgi:uncharacterized membrane protein YwaF